VTAVYVALAAPFLAAVAGLLLGPRWPRLVVPLAVGGTGVALLATVLLAAAAVVDAPLLERAQHGSAPTGAFSSLGGEGLVIGLDLRLDGLAALVSLAVGVVAFAVQVYSTAYLKGDPRYSSYAALVSLFTAAMLLVVFADDLMVLLVGWEVMGVCSYFLIGHHWEQEGARASAVKAFVVTAPSTSPRPSPPTCPSARPPWPACCCCAAWSASRPSSRCTSGCRTRWPARRRSAR
jgi:NADH-quinone oxidoreductase subunit L